MADRGLEEQVFLAIGAASTCWKNGEVPSGVFDEATAGLIATNLISYIEDNFAADEIDPEDRSLRLAILNVCNGDLTQATVAYDWIIGQKNESQFEDRVSN